MRVLCPRSSHAQSRSGAQNLAHTLIQSGVLFARTTHKSARKTATWIGHNHLDRHDHQTPLHKQLRYISSLKAHLWLQIASVARINTERATLRTRLMIMVRPGDESPSIRTYLMPNRLRTVLWTCAIGCVRAFSNYTFTRISNCCANGVRNA